MQLSTLDLFRLDITTATDEEIVALFERYDFKDPLGHPLINCVPFIKLVERATRERVASGPGTMTVRVLPCARCLQDHEIVFERLTNPPGDFDWWGMCSNARQPVWCRQGGIPPFVEVEVPRLEIDHATA